MKAILELEDKVHYLEDAKERILQKWVSFDEVMEVLSAHKIEKKYFVTHFATAIFDYYVGVVKKEKAIGDCPVMAAFLDYLNEHDISSAELFLICTHFRKSMLDALFDMDCISRQLFDEVSYVFDLNFSGVLNQYSGRIYSAQRETKVHKRRFEEYNLAIDHSAMVCKTDANGIIIYANERFSLISGFSNEELIGKKASSLSAYEKHPSFDDEMWEQLNKKEVFHGIVKNINKQNQEYYTETTIVPMLDFEGEIQEYLAIRYDVSELIKTRDAALAAERVKDQFLANMSHEIRTPLNAILGFVDVLRNRIKDSENSRYLDIIHNSGENLLTIIGDILDFAKIREGKLLIDKHWFDPVKVLSDTLELFSSKMFEKEIEYLCYIEPNLPHSLEADATRIKQIVSNFLSNALKFTPEKGCISVTVKYTNRNLIVSVKDSGCGIDKDSIGRMFTAFEQAEGSTTRKYGGTGLGLSICQRLCEMMGGDIEVESDLGEGSLFRLIVPATESDEGRTYPQHAVYIEDTPALNIQLVRRYLEAMGMQIQAEASEQSLNFYAEQTKSTKIEPYVLCSNFPSENENCLVPVYTPAKILIMLEGDYMVLDESLQQKNQYEGHILVAEDNKANQMLMKLLLDEYGLSYVMTSDGQEAYKKFKQENFSLVLMDEQMPIMGGVEASEKIVQYEHEHHLQHVPLVSVTANALKGDKERFLEAGMDAYVSKPIENVKLEAVFNKFLPRKGEPVSQNLELPSYANLSAEEMAAKIGLNAKHIPILVQSFTDESTSILEQLEAAISAKDYSDIANAAHSIKGSSGNLKFNEMYELAKDMELSAKDAKTDYPYEQAYESIKKAIESISL